MSAQPNIRRLQRTPALSRAAQSAQVERAEQEYMDRAFDAFLADCQDILPHLTPDQRGEVEQLCRTIDSDDYLGRFNDCPF